MRRITMVAVLAVGMVMGSAVAALGGHHDDLPVPPVQSNKPSLPEAAAPQADAGRAEVCHVRGDQALLLITISGNAVATHVAHGDVLPGDSVPEMEHYEYGPDCEIRSTKVVEGSFDNGTLTIGFTAYLAFDDAVEGMGSYEYTVNSNTISIDVSEYCLDEPGKSASVIGFGLSTLNGDGWLVLTLVDNGGSMSTRALWFTTEASALVAFADQCSTPVVGATGGTGSLIFF